MAGLYLEEFVIGQVIRHALTRTVTESDNVLFSVMTMNPQPLHIDFDFAAKSEWGKPLVNSLFTLGLMIGISVHDTTLGTTIANLGMTETVFPHPLFHGDTVHVETEVVSVRESKSRPDRGIVEFEHRAFNQNRRAGGEVPAAGDDHEEKEGRLTCARCCSCRAIRKRSWRKASSAGADLVIVDLEDSVAPANKVGGTHHRLGVHRRVAARGAPKIYVRVNDLSTGLTDADLAAVSRCAAGRHHAAEMQCRRRRRASCRPCCACTRPTTTWRTDRRRSSR